MVKQKGGDMNLNEFKAFLPEFIKFYKKFHDNDSPKFTKKERNKLFVFQKKLQAARDLSSRCIPKIGSFLDFCDAFEEVSIGPSEFVYTSLSLERKIHDYLTPDTVQ